MSKEWQDASSRLKDLLQLDYSPVAIRTVCEPLQESADKKVRICRAILDAGRGETVQVGRENNACFGASWHLGFQKINDPKTLGMIKRFVVEGEKLFCSYEALDTLIAQMDEVPDHSSSHFVLSPLEKAESEADVVMFICDANAACRLLTLAIFPDGVMPNIKIGGPTCRLSIIYPLLTGEVNLSFYDYTSRKMCNVEKDKLIISLPYAKIPPMIEAIEKCSAGKAKIEFPPEFREFLQKRIAG